MNIDFLSVPMIIRSLANSNSAAVNLSAPSTAALIAAMFTRFARSNRNIPQKKNQNIRVKSKNVWNVGLKLKEMLRLGLIK